jgi:predicted ArsR family transcriptional regulator
LRAALAHSGSLPGSSIDCIELRDNRLRWIILRVKEHRRIGRQFSQAELSKIAVPLELGVFDDLPETLKRRRIRLVTTILHKRQAIMQLTISQHDRELLEQLVRMGEGTVASLCDALGVTATAVRQRLNKLEANGLVARETVRLGRGRPHHAYKILPAGRRQLGHDYSELAVLLWRELYRIEDPCVREQALSRLRASLVERYSQGVSGTTTRERMSQFRDALAEQGFDIELDESRGSAGLPILRERSCPYPELAGEDKAICSLEQAVFSEVLGEPVELTACCQTGHNCCEFVVHDRADS